MRGQPFLALVAEPSPCSNASLQSSKISDYSEKMDYPEVRLRNIVKVRNRGGLNKLVEYVGWKFSFDASLLII